MITVITAGEYLLSEAPDTKVLSLDAHSFRWSADSLEYFASPEAFFPIVGKGNYRIYHVERERDLTTGAHMELSVGGSGWRGFWLPEGLPSWLHRVRPIIPTEELISPPMAPDRQSHVAQRSVR